MAAAPVRPEGVPSTARYNPEVDGFELDATDELGRRSGEYRVYRAADGTLDWLCTYREGVREGPFARFHPNGQTALEGTYARGALHGQVIAYASDAPTSLLLQPCCVPRGAWELRSDYREGRLLRQVFYDREGYALGSNGARWPDRPARVPPAAEYDDESALWLLRSELERGALLLRRWDRAGTPLSVTEYRAGKRVREQALDASGAPTDEYHFDEEGRHHGPSTRWFSEARTPYSNATIREERGQFWHGQPVGSFTWLDGEAEVVARREFGAGLTEAMLAASEVLGVALEDATPDSLWASSSSLQRSGRVREAIIAAARATARGGAPKRFATWLEDVRLSVTSDLANALGDELLARPDVTANDALSALLVGSEPVAALRALAGTLNCHPRAALDVVEAAILLAPERRATRITRAFLRLELGQLALVLEDAADFEREAPEVSAHLRRAVRVFFPTFAFWPAQESLAPQTGDEASVEVRQPLDRVQRLVRVYATRLVRLAEASRRLIGESHRPWAWPELGELLPLGPIELDQSTALIEDETENGTETTEVGVDEALDLDARSVDSIATAARAAWGALCWLCWAVGLDAVALPRALMPRAELGSAVNLAVFRCGRLRDQTQTGGLISRARGVPDFVWEGTPIGELDARFVAVAVAEYSELRALFFWLMFEQNVSPFQSDIRAT